MRQDENVSDYSRFHFLVSGDLTFKPENFKVGSRACMDTRTCLSVMQRAVRTPRVMLYATVCS